MWTLKPAIPQQKHTTLYYTKLLAMPPAEILGHQWKPPCRPLAYQTRRPGMLFGLVKTTPAHSSAAMRQWYQHAFQWPDFTFLYFAYFQNELHFCRGAGGSDKSASQFFFLFLSAVGCILMHNKFTVPACTLISYLSKHGNNTRSDLFDSQFIWMEQRMFLDENYS